jgi:hypothetical protein
MTMKQGSKKGVSIIGLAAVCVSIIGLAAHAQTPSQTAAPAPPPSSPAGPPEPDGRGPLTDRFDEIDTNKDGKLTRDELEAFHKKHAPPEGGCRGRMLFDRKQDHPGGPKEPPKEPKDMKQRPELDANKDGKVTLDEFLAPHKQLFARLDANHNGVLEGDEVPYMPPPMCGRDGPPPPPPPQ